MTTESCFGFQFIKIDQLIMETIKIPIGIYIIIKSITWIMVAATLSVLTTYQFRSWFYQKSPVTLPIFFVMETLPDPQCQPMHEEQKPLRKHSFLQANFSLINQYDDILKIPVEYEIEVKLVVPDYEIRGFHPYDEGMFLTCLRLIDREENTVWPLVNPWNAEVPMIRNSRCRSSILLKQSLMQTIFERLWSIWHLRLTSLQYWQRTQDIVTLIGNICNTESPNKF